jgi:hypothetical protein
MATSASCREKAFHPSHVLRTTEKKFFLFLYHIRKVGRKVSKNKSVACIVCIEFSNSQTSVGGKQTE